MARGVNKVILVGNLGNDPVQLGTPSGGLIVNLSVATSESWKDKNTGQQVETTEWHKIVLFNRLAEVAAQYLTKGSQVYIEGKLKTRKWQDRAGNDHYTTEIVASDMKMLGGSRQADQQGMPAAPPQNSQQQADSARAYRDASGGSSQAKRAPADDGFDDDIPF